MALSFLRAAVCREPDRHLLRAERLLDDLVIDLVDDVVIGRRKTRDHRFALTPVRVDDRLIVVVGERVEREANAGDVAVDLLLHDHRDSR